MDSTPVSLLERLREPDPGPAWSRFVELYTPLLLRWARGRGLQAHDAVDLVQEVFVTLLQKLPEFTYEPGKSFRGWLRTVARNKWQDCCRRRGTLPALGPSGLDGVADHRDGEPFWESDHRRQLVWRALEVMQSDFEPTTWKACWEFVVEGRPAAEVAQHLGVSENAVYIAKCRVMRRLRRELEGLLD